MWRDADDTQPDDFAGDQKFVRAGALVTGAIALAPDADALQQEQKKTKVVVLGTGWGATSFLNALKPKHSMYQLVPTLPSMCLVHSCDFEKIVEFLACVSAPGLC